MSRRVVAALTTMVVGVGVVVGAAGTAAADTAPPDASTPKTVSADPLPTAQIDGVAWTQAVVGNRVFVGGSFTTARPAGSPAGTNTVPRSNIMAYDIRTGELDQGFQPVLDGQVLTMALSPDKSTLYVGGDFTHVDGTWRVRLAAFDTGTGALKSGFRTVASGTVRAIAANDDTVYFGGDFTAVGDAPGTATVARPYLAAASAATGAARTDWTASTDAGVTAMTLNNEATRLIVGGRFKNVSGTAWHGMAALDPADGSVQPWAATSVLRNAGVTASWTSLTADAQGVYGTGYTFGRNDGNFEGVFRADGTTGEIAWLADCHGDHYSAFARGDAVYTTSHAHHCGNFGSFNQTDPWTKYHSGAVTNHATTTVLPDIYGYASFTGQPGPTQLNWFPTWLTGTYTTSKQAGWHVTGNDDYVVVAGEFIGVNGGAQQGLVRFANAAGAPNKVKPTLDAGLTPALSSHESGEVHIGWRATHDRDNTSITYKVYRNFTSVKDTPIHETTVQSTFWQRPTVDFIDKGLPPGSTQEYRVLAFDPWGNYVTSEPASVVVSGVPVGVDYRRALFADSPSHYYPLDDVGTDGVVRDLAGSDNLASQGGITAVAQGALQNGPAGAAAFTGNATGFASGQVSQVPSDTLSLEAWFRTSSTSGGKIVGYGPRQTGSSPYADRHLYLDNSGRVHFGVDNGSKRDVASGTGLNDGKWHHVVGTLAGDGMRLFVDGTSVGLRGDVVAGRRYSGVLRVGGDVLSDWPNQPTTGYLKGDIDEVAVYLTALSRAQVDKHFTASGRASQVAAPPSDAYAKAVYDRDPELYWRLEETSGTQAADAGLAGNRGNVINGVSWGQEGALWPTPGRAASFNGSNGLIVASKGATNPREFTVGVWFRTTTTKGGKLIGFGNKTSGLSTSYDRHVYMQNDGKLVFGAYDGQKRTVTSPTALNDGSWHFVTGTQAADGMKLYVDGALVGSNSFAANENYAGYWRIGGDQTWGSTSSYFNGVLDDAMVFSRALTGAEVSDLRWLAVEPPPNQSPTAAFTTSSAWMDVAVDGSGSTDPDGTIASYAWDFGDGTTATGVTPAAHTYATPGSYEISLTVTDNRGGTATTTNTVDVVEKPNENPIAGFTHATSGLEVSVDGATSVDPEGSMASYDWDFGDGATATGVKPPPHAYAAVGTYTVTLTVTDNKGATGMTSQPVTINAALVEDAFGRSVAAGWGNADKGGAWSTCGTTCSSVFSVVNGAGQVSVKAGSGPEIDLNGVASTSTDMQVDVTLDRAATGGGSYAALVVRGDWKNGYRAKARMMTDGSIQLVIVRVLDRTETVVSSWLRLPAGTFAAGVPLTMRAQAVGTSPTQLRFKVWRAGTAEPTDWQLTATDSDATWQKAGSVGLWSFVSSTATNGPAIFRYDNLAVRTVA